MSETQPEVLDMIEAVAKGRGEPVNQFMDSEFGAYWSHRYYTAQPDEPVVVETPKKAASIPDTNAFSLLRARAKELLAKDGTLTEAQAITKASEIFPDLTARHVAEIRKVARG